MLNFQFLIGATLAFSLLISHTQTSSTIVATVNLQQAILDSKEFKRELAAVKTKVLQERQQRAQQIAQDVLTKMLRVIEQFRTANGLGIILDTSDNLPEPIFWTRQHGGDLLRKQVNITKPVVDSLDRGLVHLAPIRGDQNVVVIDVQQAIFTSEDGKRKLAGLGNNVTPEQKAEISKGILLNIGPVIDKLARDIGADIVLDSSQKWPDGPILLIDPRLDITEEVVTAFNGR